MLKQFCEPQNRDVRSKIKMAKFKEALKHFAQTTSAHGVGRVAEEKAAWTRVLWAIIFMTTLSTCIYQLIVLTGIYLSYPVNRKETVSVLSTEKIF